MLVVLRQKDGKLKLVQNINDLEYLIANEQHSLVTIFSSCDDERIFDILAEHCIYEFVYISDSQDSQKEELLQAISYIFSELYDIDWNITVIKQNVTKN